MYKKGLVSISFRELSPMTIIENVKAANLEGIEWGGDIHVPEGEMDIAKNVEKAMRENGLETLAYGSYYRVGCTINPEKRFLEVLKTAVCLKTDTLRVWAYDKGSDKTNDEDFEKVSREAGKIAEMAKDYGIRVCMECHMNTLTDTAESASMIINRAESDNLYMYWQPNFVKEEENLEYAKQLLPFITNVHVFNWRGGDRFPLSEAKTSWGKYFELLKTSKHKHNFLLEFMPDDDINSLKTEAACLNRIVTAEG